MVGAVSAGVAARQRAVPAPQKLRFEVPSRPRPPATPVTGRVFVMISRTNDREPRLQIGRPGVPFFGHDVRAARRARPPSSTSPTSALPSRACATSRRRVFRPGRSSTSTRSSSAPTATSSGCTTISGRGSAGTDRRAICTATCSGHGSTRSRAAPIALTAAARHATRRGARRHGVREAIQVPEPHADEILGTPDLPRRHRAPAARLRNARRCPTRCNYIQGHFSTGRRLYGFDENERLLEGVARRTTFRA